MTELDPLDETLEQARAALAPSFDDDARLRRALGLGPAGPLPSAGGGHASVQQAVAPPAAELRAVEPRAVELRAEARAVASRASSSSAGLLGLRSWRALRAAGSAGLVAGAVLVGLGFGAGLWVGRSGIPVASQPLGEPHAAIERTGSPAAVPQPASFEPHAPIAPEETAEEPPALDDPPPPRARPNARRAARRAPDRAHAAASNGANEELALLRRVERALRAQNPALALALIAELDQRFPDTRLAEEREAARVIASCGMAEGGARFRAERFSREHGGSVYAERVREACALAEGSVRSEGSAPAGDQ